MGDGLDERAGTLAIRRSVYTHGAGSGWGETKTGEARTIRLPPSVRDLLERHRAMQAEERLAAKGWEGPRPMFRRHPESSGLPRVRFHDLRHTAAVMMLNSGVPINVLSQILGHKDPTMTLRRYAHVLSEAQQIAADRIDGYGF